MAYLPLPVPLKAPQELRDAVSRLLDPLFADVHAMMRLPLPEAGLHAGCNLSAALSLLEVVGGISSIFYVHPDLDGKDQRTQRRERFLRVLAQFFPWEQERHLSGAITGLHASTVLYEAFRSPLAHALGVYDGPYLGNIKVAKGPLSELEIESIERATVRPTDWSRSTLYTDSNVKEERTKTVLTVKCLYWGVRQTVCRLLSASVNRPVTYSGYGVVDATSAGITATSTGAWSYDGTAPKTTS